MRDENLFSSECGEGMKEGQDVFDIQDSYKAEM